MQLTSAQAQNLLTGNNFMARFNDGYLRFYSGTPPVDADTALSGNTLLGAARYNATAFSTSGHTATANTMVDETNAAASGTATFCRAYESDGTTLIGQMSCRASGDADNGEEVVITSTAITAAGAIVMGAHTLAA